MAKIRIPQGMTLQEVISEMAAIGITVDRHQLPDGAYRCYVTKSRINLLLNHPERPSIELEGAASA